VVATGNWGGKDEGVIASTGVQKENPGPSVEKQLRDTMEKGGRRWKKLEARGGRANTQEGDVDRETFRKKGQRTRIAAIVPCISKVYGKKEKREVRGVSVGGTLDYQPRKIRRGKGKERTNHLQRRVARSSTKVLVGGKQQDPPKKRRPSKADVGPTEINATLL